MDEITVKLPHVEQLERRVDAICNLLSGLTLGGILADIVLATPTATSRNDKIIKKRKKCTVTVAVDVSYEGESTRVERDKEGNVVKTCTTYKITTKVTISEVCDPASDAQAPKTSTHVSHKEFCSGDGGDVPKTGETVDFDGKEIDTLTYPHGTKVTVTKSGDTVTVTVTYPDGTTVTTTF
jgi:hypothetical protein